MKCKLIKGFSLVEVLIAFVILIIGLLGATTLVIRSSQANMTAYETEQVALVVNSFVEKVRFNNADTAIEEYAKAGAGENMSNCINNACSAQSRAKLDKYVFQEQLNALSLANANPRWTLETEEKTIEATKYNLCKLAVVWGEDDTKNSYRINFMIKQVTP